MSTAERLMECTNCGAQAVSRCASPPTSTVVTSSARHRGTTHCGIFFSLLIKVWKHHWMEWVFSVCPTFIREQCYLQLFFSWELPSELSELSHLSRGGRASEPWKKKRQQKKEKQAELRGGENYLCPKNTVVWAKAVWSSSLFLT